MSLLEYIRHPFSKYVIHPSGSFPCSSLVEDPTLWLTNATATTPTTTTIIPTTVPPTLQDELLFEKHTEMGNQWTKLSGRFPGRTENGVKNRFHSAHFKVWCGEKGYSIREDSRKGGPPKKNPTPAL